MTRPIRLFVIGVRWPPETFIERRLYGLADAGFEVVVCTSSAGQTDHPHIRLLRLPRLGYGILPYGYSFRLLAKHSLRHPGQVWGAWKRARQFAPDWKESIEGLAQQLPFLGQQPDIVHFEWNRTAITYLPYYDLLACPVVISCRGSQVQISPHKPGADQADLIAGLHESFARAAAVHCVSAAIKREAAQYGLEEAKGHVIRPAVDPDFFTPAAERLAAGGPLRIISTGSITWVKGYEYALIALRHLLDRGVTAHYTIIGGGDEEQRLRYTIHDLGLADSVTLAGRLRPEQVREALQSADIFLLPSVSEGISNAALEGMACGLPVVTTACGGMEEAVTDGAEGLVVPVRDPAALADALAALAADPARRAAMGAAGRARILRQFTLKQQIEAFVALYNKIINSHSARLA